MGVVPRPSNSSWSPFILQLLLPAFAPRLGAARGAEGQSGLHRVWGIGAVMGGDCTCMGQRGVPTQRGGPQGLRPGGQSTPTLLRAQITADTLISLVGHAAAFLAHLAHSFAWDHWLRQRREKLGKASFMCPGWVKDPLSLHKRRWVSCPGCLEVPGREGAAAGTAVLAAASSSPVLGSGEDGVTQESDFPSHPRHQPDFLGIAMFLRANSGFSPKSMYSP